LFAQNLGIRGIVTDVTGESIVGANVVEECTTNRIVTDVEGNFSMQVLCFDKIESFQIANIPINYIEQPIREMGEKAVDMLIEQINGSDEVRRCIFDAAIYLNSQIIHN
jgi:DNA-binding LacI/PurR family transcriptional regulator